LGRTRILLVEDNPLTRQVLRDILAVGGYEVVEAGDGASAVALLESTRPHLVLQDMILPDCEGPALLRRLRATPGGTVPIVALSGLPDSGDALNVPGGGFNDYLEKPITPSALLLAVRAHVDGAAVRGDAPTGSASTPAAGRHVLVVLPEGPVDIVTGHLEGEGYRVTSGVDGADALAEILRAPPSAVVAGGLLPRLDGVALARCMAETPATAEVPVLLVVEDQATPSPALLRAAGIARVIRESAGAAAVAEALLATASAPRCEGSHADFVALHDEWLRATAVAHRRTSTDLQRRCDLQAAALSILDVLATSMSASAGRGTVPNPGELLTRCLTTAGTSRGAAFLREEDGSIRVAARVGFADESLNSLSRLFGHDALLRAVMDENRVAVVPGTDLSESAGADLLRSVGARSLLLVPLHRGGGTAGALLMASTRFDLVNWVDVTRAVAFQMSQALELGRIMSRLSASEAAHRGLFQSSVLGIYRSSGQGRLLEVNGALVRLLGYESADELEGGTTEHIYRHPEERARLMSKYRGADRFDGLEVDWLRKDGSVVTVRLTGRAVRDADGRHDGFEVFVEDITGRREMEEEIRQAQRMEAVRRLAAGVAHEYRNLLTTMAGHADLMLAGLDADSPLRPHAEAIQRAAETAEGVTHDLLAFGATRDESPKVVDLEEVVDSTVPTLRRALGESIELTRETCGQRIGVRLDPHRWEQALLFLALHAKENMAEGGTLTISTSSLSDATGERPRAVVEFRDTGRPLGEEERANLLVPRFGPGQSHELGLATVYGLVRQAGGQVAVLRGSGGGTRIRIMLPALSVEAAATRAPDPEPEASSSAPPLRPEGGKETILVAEDEEAVRGLMAATLRREGYDVLEAANGEEALREAAQHHGPLHLLLTDVVMPRMGGRRLAQALRGARPGVPVLFVSGYTEHASAQEEGGARLDEGDFLQKPFTPRVLAARVREVLDTAAHSNPGRPEAGGGETGA
jgi:PAS domain S-box-containing protein